MHEVMFTGPDGRLEGRFSPAIAVSAPLALVLHSHPKGQGTMEDPIAVRLFEAFRGRGFAVLRFNFRGVGRSQGTFDHGFGELSDAASALDWMQSFNAAAPYCWVAGYSFGAYIAMQLLMRRPEVKGFIAVAPPMNLYDFTFLAPCPASGQIFYGERDLVAPPDDIERVASKIRSQKGVEIRMNKLAGANHFFHEHLDKIETDTGLYLDERMGSKTP